MSETHFRDFTGDNETPVCNERSGSTTINPDEVTCPVCRVLLPRFLTQFTPPPSTDSRLEDMLRRTLGAGFRSETSPCPK